MTYSVIDTRPEKKMIAWCLQHDVKLLAYGCVDSGVLFICRMQQSSSGHFILDLEFFVSFYYY